MSFYLLILVPLSQEIDESWYAELGKSWSLSVCPRLLGFTIVCVCGSEPHPSKSKKAVTAGKIEAFQTVLFFLAARPFAA